MQAFLSTSQAFISSTYIYLPRPRRSAHRRHAMWAQLLLSTFGRRPISLIARYAIPYPFKPMWRPKYIQCPLEIGLTSIGGTPAEGARHAAATREGALRLPSTFGGRPITLTVWYAVSCPYAPMRRLKHILCLLEIGLTRVSGTSAKGAHGMPP